MGGRLVQIALCAVDIPRTVRRYADGLGFLDAGGHMQWGPRVAAVQGLGDDMEGCIWWLVTEQELVQLELFRHTKPVQRPLPVDWRPSDLGWVRWGVAVADLDAAVSRLRSLGVGIPAPVVLGGRRRTCFRDPDIGNVVEVLEGSSGAPRILYATLSVADLDVARSLYVDALELREVDTNLHPPEVELLWGLPDARCESFVIDGAGVLVEIVHYSSPPGRPLPPDHRLSDQGMMNVAVGYRERVELDRALEQALAAGCTASVPLPDRPVTATYLTDSQGFSLELSCVPVGYEQYVGFVPKPTYLLDAR